MRARLEQTKPEESLPTNSGGIAAQPHPRRRMSINPYHFQKTISLHFIPFNCDRHGPQLETPAAKEVFEEELESVRDDYGLSVAGYVVMPDHVHLLLSEPVEGILTTALYFLQQQTAYRFNQPEVNALWQIRYYDFYVWSDMKRMEKLDHIHRNPVTRGLV